MRRAAPVLLAVVGFAVVTGLAGGEMRDELRAWLNSQGRRFGLSEAAAELGTLLREKPAPQETRAFPIEKGMLLTPEEEATAEAEVTRSKACREV